jgi:nucleotide-binding universal stress UspA family protein
MPNPCLTTRSRAAGELTLINAPMRRTDATMARRITNLGGLAMTYATLLVHMQPGRPNTGLLRLTADLAERFDAAVTGVTVSQSVRIIYSEGYIPTDVIQKDRAEREREITAAEAEFRAVLGPRVRHLAWRASIVEAPLSEYLCQQARCADLVITGVDHEDSMFDHSRHLEIGDFVMHVGRPVLVVPSKPEGLKFDSVLIGWKDSRETRRAIADALPFLKKATRVSVVEIAPEARMEAARTSLDDVVGWLSRHGVAAEPRAVTATGDDPGQLEALSREQDAGLFVAGAYGHSRVREWVLGGVTRDLLLRGRWCSLVSH